MRGSKDIVILVLSLTARERRFFKKSYDSDNEFMVLYDFILKQRKFSVPEFNAFLAKKQNRKELYTSGYISTLRQYLKEKILDSLRKIHAKSDPRTELWNNLLVHRVLVTKGLIDLGWKELDYNYEKRDQLFPVDRLVLLQQISIYLFSKGVKENSFEEIEAIYRERKMIIVQHENEIELSRLVSLVSLCLQKNLVDEQLLNEIEQDPILAIDPEKFCFTNRYIFFWIKSVLNLLKGQFGTGFKNFNLVINLWISNPQRIKAYPDLFISACHYYLKIIQARYPGNYNQADEEFINSFLNSLRTASKEIDQQEKLESFIFFFEIIVTFNKGEFEKVIKAEENIENLLSNNLETTYSAKVYYYYILAVAYRAVGESEMSLEKLEKIIFDKEAKRENSLYFSKANLLYLMNHVELGNWYFVKHEWKKRVRVLEKSRKLSELEISLFDFFKKVFLKKNSQKIPSLFTDFSLTLNTKMKDRKHLGRYHDLPLSEWISRLIEKENYPDF